MIPATPFSHYLEGLISSLDTWHGLLALEYGSSFYTSMTYEDFSQFVIDRGLIEWSAGPSSGNPDSSVNLLNGFESVMFSINNLIRGHFKTIQDWDAIISFLEVSPTSSYRLEKIEPYLTHMHNNDHCCYVTMYFTVKTPGRYPSNFIVKPEFPLVDLKFNSGSIF